MRAWRRPASAGLAMALIGGSVLGGVAIATSNPRTIEQVTTDWGAGDQLQGARLSADGEIVIFTGPPTVPASPPGSVGYQVFAVDLGTSQIEQVSVDSSGDPLSDSAFPGGMSGDARFVTFTDYNPLTRLLEAYLRDRQSGTTEIVSVPDSGFASNNHGGFAAVDVSDDGRYVAFTSTASNLLPAGIDTNGKADVFVRDRQLGTTTRLNLGPLGEEADGDSDSVAISGDGSTIVFASSATNLIGPGADTNGQYYTFVVDRASLEVERVSVSGAGAEGDGSSGGCGTDLNDDGSLVIFTSAASTLVPGDTNFAADVFLRDRTLGTTVRVSVTYGGAQGGSNGSGGSYAPVMSADGTRIAFASGASLDPADTGFFTDVYVRDLAAGTTELISRTPLGAGGNDHSGECINVLGVAMDASGEVFAFMSRASDLTVDPDNDALDLDVFVSRPAPADGDGDGITDDIDLNPGASSTSFSDGTTFGQILTVPAGFAVAIRDSIAPELGVHVTITGSGIQKVRFLACGAFTVLLPAGFDGDVTCGSVIVQPSAGSPPADVVLGNGLVVITIPGGASAEVDAAPGGGFTIENVSGGNVTVLVDGSETTVEPGETLSGSAWDFDGFKAPIDNGTVLNAAKAGKVIPVRWRIVDETGAPVTNLASATLTVRTFTCPGAGTVDQLEEYTAGSSGLLNQGNGNYQLNWQTAASYANSCKTLRLDVGDGVLHTALFRFTK